MEQQRTGPSTQAVHGAATDPAFVPGITGLPGLPGLRPDMTGSQDASEQPRDVTGPQEAPEHRDPAAAGAAAGAAEPDPVEPDPDGPDPDGPDPDGPVFEAADRRARIVADATGVRLSLDEESCEFRWDEIGAVETSVARFGKRFTVVVHTPDRRWYPIDVDAPAKDRVKEWETLLDAVLDAYFDENA